jgi:hypothetical protein
VSNGSPKAQAASGAAPAGPGLPPSSSEAFSAPLDAVIGAVVQGVANAQTALDQSSLANQEAIDANPELAGKELQAPWYQLARTDVQLKLAFGVGEGAPAPGVAEGAPRPGQTAAAMPVATPALNLPALHLIAQPVSAAYQNHFNFNAQAASTITLSLAPVPPRQPSSGSVAPAQLSAEEVQTLALQSNAGFRTKRGPRGTRVPSGALRFAMQYNPSARTWYVHQHSPGDPSSATVVAVDDVTRETRVLRRRS